MNVALLRFGLHPHTPKIIGVSRQVIVNEVLAAYMHLSIMVERERPDGLDEISKHAVMRNAVGPEVPHLCPDLRRSAEGEPGGGTNDAGVHVELSIGQVGSVQQ